MEPTSAVMSPAKQPRPQPLLTPGLGTLLVRRLIDHARRRGLRELFGQVLRENARMLGICRRLGFREKADPETPWVTVVSLAP